MSGQRRASIIGVLLAVTGAVSYGVTVVLGRRLAADGLGPATALGARFVIAAAVLALVVRMRGVSLRPEPGEAFRLLLLGAIGYTAESTLFFLALQRGTAATCALLFYAYPAFVLLIELARRREHARPALLAALALSTGGVVLIVTSALGLAAGAHLAGRRPVVLMQNSGLGYGMNVITSLHLIYDIPLPLVITWRGYRDDAVEHDVIGPARAAGRDQGPVPPHGRSGLRRDLVAGQRTPAQRAGRTADHGAVMSASAQPQQTLFRLRDAIDRAAGGAPILWVSSCGYISRDLHALGDGPVHFYLVGSMGMALPVALGVASARPDRLVVAVDGDGSALMT